MSERKKAKLCRVSHTFCSRYCRIQELATSRGLASEFSTGMMTGYSLNSWVREYMPDIGAAFDKRQRVNSMKSAIRWLLRNQMSPQEVELICRVCITSEMNATKTKES